MTLFESGDPRPIYFMGIAGAGMSGLALLARHQGAEVTGCDKDPQGSADLAALGVVIWWGHDLGHVSGARAVVNNVEADHLECYGTVQALEDAFVQFAGRARRVIAGADDAGAGRVAARVSGPVWRVGLARDADVRIADPELDDAGSRARVVLPDGRELRLALGVPGLHNLRNAGAALAVACELGADVEACIAALAGFAGVARRFERLG